MAGRGYGGRRESWRERGSSIFSDDDDDRRIRGADRDEDRGFFERAGDEVRSWFGDEEAERRRERDLRRDDARSAFGEPEDGRDPHRVGGRTGQGRSGGWESSSDADRPIFNRDTLAPAGESLARDAGETGSGRLGRRGTFGGSQWDDHYRSWRAQQMEQFDREYEDYRRERQQRFEEEFDSWRTSRLTRGGTTGSRVGTGNVDVTAASGEADATTRSLGTEGAVASSDLGGTASATQASTGAAGEEASPATRGRGRSGS